MSFFNFLTGNDQVNLSDKFLSPRLVKDAIGKKFNIRIIEERPDYIKFRIIRFARLYGAPFIWPQASIEVCIDNENDTLIYKFFWPEYFALIIPFILFFAVGEKVKEFFSFYIFALIFFCSIMFLDTKWVSSRVRKAFKNII